MFFTDNLMCRINAVGHFTQRQVRSVAGCPDDVVVMSWWCHSVLTIWQLFGQLDRTHSEDISDHKSLEHKQCSSTTVPFNQCRRVVIVASQRCPKKLTAVTVVLVGIRQESYKTMSRNFKGKIPSNNLLEFAVCSYVRLAQDSSRFPECLLMTVTREQGN